jgi:hypothetical protein
MFPLGPPQRAFLNGKSQAGSISPNIAQVYSDLAHAIIVNTLVSSVSRILQQVSGF